MAGCNWIVPLVAAWGIDSWVITPAFWPIQWAVGILAVLTAGLIAITDASGGS